MNKEISYFKKALVLLMAVMMVFTMMPSMAWADETSNETAAGSEASNIAENGIDGNIAWSLDKEGTLSISKANTEAENDGSMNDYQEPDWDGNTQVPWMQEHQADIKKLIISEGVTTIGDYAFYGCRNLDSVQFATSVNSIGDSAFAYTRMSQPIIIPKTVKTIYGYAFSYSKVTDVTLEGGEGNTYRRSIFAYCEDLKTVNLPSTMTQLPMGMFEFCSAIAELEIPDGITSMGKQKQSPLAGMSSLKQIIIPEGIKQTYEQMFNGCSNLRHIEFKGITEIAANTFEGCTEVRELILPATLTSYKDTTQKMLPKLICFGGTEEQWNTAVPEATRQKWAGAGTVVVFNYDAANVGTAATITTQPKSAIFAIGDQVKDLTVTVADDPDMQLVYTWYMDDGNGYKFVNSKADNPAAVTPEYSKSGTYKYYCEIKSVKDSKVASVNSEVATITVTDAKIPFTESDTEENTYLIRTTEDFDSLARLVNGGISFGGITFKMTNDITLSDNWTPIGTTKDGTGMVKGNGNILPFSGTIDGDGYLLTVPKGKKPLLAYVLDANVRNLNIYGEQIDGYGLVDEFKGVGLSGNAITIDNVTIKEGSNILKSGFLGTALDLRVNGYAGCSAGFSATITNSTIEKGVTIGYDGTQSEIGAFAGRFQGTISNCVSEATVKGVDYVGGIVGTRDNAMGLCKVNNCIFKGEVIASGKYAGGIVGGGYSNQSAPNGIHIDVRNCRSEGTITGNVNVGGILGGDGFIAQAWNSYGIIGNTFSGTITGKENVGGIIGFYDSLNKMDNIAGNFFTKNRGTTKGIGAVKYVDTNAKKPTAVTGTTYFNTEKGISDCPTVEGCEWKANYNRTDDPLGADKEKLAKAVDTIPTEAFCYELVLKSGMPETKYYIGDEFDFKDAVFTAKMTDGTEKDVDTKDITVSGYDKDSHSVQTVILSYGYAQYELQVAVLKKASGGDKKETITVSFTLLGDDSHNEDEATHTLSQNNLKRWIEEETYTLDINATAGELFKAALKKHNIKWEGTDNNKYNTLYVSGVENPTTKQILSELDNGPYSGWMYTINGSHPEVGIDARFLNDGEEMIFHYTDDYNKEEGSDKWNTPGAGVIEEIKEVTTDTKTGTTTAPTEVKVTEKANADGTTSKVAEVKVTADNQKEILKQAKANKSKEIILSVATKAAQEATKAEVTLDKSFIDSIVKDTDAKLTVKTPFGDKTYTQDELKALSEAVTAGSTVTIAVEKAAEEPTVDVKALTAKLTPVARSAKTAKKNVKVTVSLDKQDKEILSQLKEAGYTVKYRFYRSTKKSAGYKSTVTKKTATYTNTSGKKGTKYFYKVQVRVYDESGKLVAKTALKQCKYATRTWSR